MSFAIEILQANLSQAERNLKWLKDAQQVKGTKYFENEHKKWKTRHDSLVKALRILQGKDDTYVEESYPTKTYRRRKSRNGKRK